MGKRSKKWFRLFAKNWPGFQRFGFYSLFPFFFAAGVGLELFMVKFQFQGHNFYQTFNRRQLETLREEIEDQEELKKQLTAKLKKQNAVSSN